MVSSSLATTRRGGNVTDEQRPQEQEQRQVEQPTKAKDLSEDIQRELYREQTGREPTAAELEMALELNLL